MRGQVFLLCAVALLRGAFGNALKNCDDCTAISSCVGATKLALNDSAVRDELWEAFCGFNNGTNPKVCCSMLSNANGDNTESHPNLKLLPQSCGEIFRSKLLGGSVTEIYQFPWLALIAFRTRFGPRFECVGTLINERYVLTSADCLPLDIVGVRIGEHDFNTITDCQGAEPYAMCESHVQDLRIAETIVHPSYQGHPSYTSNIGLIRLKTPVDLTVRNAKTICLPVTKDLQKQNLSGLCATVAGWELSDPRSSKMQSFNIPIHTKNNCSAVLDSFDFADKLCAGGYGRSSHSDNRGPLMVARTYDGVERFFQYGTFTIGHPEADTPTVYTDVSKYVKWILDTIRP